MVAEALLESTLCQPVVDPCGLIGCSDSGLVYNALRQAHTSQWTVLWLSAIAGTLGIGWGSVGGW